MVTVTPRHCLKRIMRTFKDFVANIAVIEEK